MRISAAASLRGEFTVPGDKSISHRYAILGAMASGQTVIRNYSSSRDCQSTIDCLRGVGVSIRRVGRLVEIDGRGWESIRSPADLLDAGNSGTTIRLLSALLSSAPILSTIAGDESLNSRPMDRIMIPLSRMGAEIQARLQQFPPLTIRGARLQAIEYELPVSSAQVKSCVLLAGLTAEGRTTVVENTPTRDHTERALPHFGAEFSGSQGRFSVQGGKRLIACEVDVPGDFSSAVFFMVAAMLLPGSEIRIRNVGLNPSRTALLTYLLNAGAEIETADLRTVNSEPAADLVVRHSPEIVERFPSNVDPRWIPNLIDEIPLLAVLGCHLEGGLEIRGASELRRKESDRIRAVVDNLRVLGVEVEEFEDGFRIAPNSGPTHLGRVRTFADHRIAMAFSVAGLLSRDGVELDDPGCAAVSFPEFYSILESVAR
jgi:3-phosphoshikimate 1-carboxyvinyltransferase